MTVPSARCFLAIEVEAPIRAEVVRLEEAIGAAMPSAREAMSWVGEPNVHLTLVFLGPVSPAQIEKLTGGLTSIATLAARFDLETTRPGIFGSAERPKVLWLGMNDPDGRLHALQAQVAGVCAELNLGVDDHAYHPHLTAARPRVNAKRAVLAKIAAGWVALPSTSQRHTVTAFSLMRSEMQPGGPKYTRLARFDLGSA